MKRAIQLSILLALVPLVASAQYKDLDTAMSSVRVGFERGESHPLIAGMADGDQVMLQFPGLVRESGFFGRDQAAYLLDELFQKAKPSRFQQVSARKVSSEGQYHITANWTVQVNGESTDRELYITLKSKGERWSIASIRSAGR